MKPEARIQKSIIDWLEYHGAIALRTNAGMIRTQNGSMVRVGEAGTSDITCCWFGQFVAIEVKTPKGKVTDLQQAYLDRVNTAGGIAFVARSLDDVVARLER